MSSGPWPPGKTYPGFILLHQSVNFWTNFEQLHTQVNEMELLCALLFFEYFSKTKGITENITTLIVR